LPPWWRAYSQLNSAVRAPPMWRKPVGEGAKRVTTVMVPCIAVRVEARCLARKRAEVVIAMVFLRLRRGG
jgi:hypothetical protein